MRRSGLVVALVLATAVAPAAQATFGVRAGVSAIGQSFSSDYIYDDNDSLSKQSRLGVTVGIFADLPFSEGVSLRPGVSYVQKGYHVILEEREPFAGSSTQGADYLEVPVLLGIRVPGTGALELDVEAGPTLGYRVRTLQRCEGGFVPGCEAFPYGDDLADFEFGGAVGLAVGAGPFGVEVGYTRSVMRVDDPDIDSFSDVRYGGLTAGARYVFGR